MVKYLESINEFNEFISEGKVLIDFFATWCGPCKMVAPVLEEVESEIGKEVKIAKVDVDLLREVAQKYGIASIPTFVVLDEGVEIKRAMGYMPKKNIIDLVK